LANKTYENLIMERETSLAIENVFIAPYGTSWTATPIQDILAPPTGFTWLGAVVEDSPNMTVSREKFQLSTGIPKVLQYEAVTSVAGRFECMLYSNSPRKVQYALGNVDARNVFTEGTSFSQVGTTPAATQYQVTLDASPQVAYAVGDYLAIHSDSSTIVVSQNEAQISSISGLTLYFGTPGFPTTPADLDYVGKVAYVSLPFGTNLIRTYTLLGVAEFVDNVQIVHKLTKVAAGAEFSEQFRPDDVGKIPLSFDCYGLSNADYGSSQLIVGERFWFPTA
jgi:hypothetical protein